MDRSVLNPDKGSGLLSDRSLIKSARFQAWALVALELIAGGVLMLLFLGEKSFWLDEALSVSRASRDWSSLWREISEHQANMGLYYVLLHFWLGLGKTEFAVRGLSVVFALATIPFVYALLARLFGEQEGLTAALLVTINAFFIRYAQEARGYSLAILLVCISCYFFVRSIHQPSMRNWLGYVFSSALSGYAHIFAILVLISQPLSLPFLHRQDIPWKGLIASGAIIVLSLSPMVLFAIFRDAGQIDWVPEPGVKDLHGLFLALSGQGGEILLVVYGLACLVALFWGLRTWLAHRASFDTWRFAFLFTWLLVPVLIAFSFSFIKPLFYNRFLLVSLPPLAMLAAVGLSRIRNRLFWTVLLVMIVVLSADSLRRWYVIAEKEYWRRATSYILLQAKAGDAILFYVYYGKVPFEYYTDRLGLQKNHVDILELSSAPYIAGTLQPDPSERILNALPSRHPRIWLVRFHDGTRPGHRLRRYEQRQRIHESLVRHYSVKQNVFFRGGIRVQLYEKVMGGDERS